MPGVPPDAVAQVKRGLRGLFSRKKRSQADTESSPPPAPQQQQPPPESKQPAQNPTITTTAPSPSPGQTPDTHSERKLTDDGFPPPPPGKPPGNNGITPSPPPSTTQIPSPSGIAEAKDIDLDPSSPCANPPPTASAPTTSPAVTEATVPETTSSAPTSTTPAPALPSDIKSPTETFHTAAATPTTESAKKVDTDPHGMSATSGPLDDSAMMFGTGRASADADGREFLNKERDLEDDRPKGPGRIVEEGENKAEGAKTGA